jgi:hypothetical protein
MEVRRKLEAALIGRIEDGAVIEFGGRPNVETAASIGTDQEPVGP